MKYDANGALITTQIDGLPEPRRGKVRDLYDLGDSLLLIATDRLSAFDVVMPNGIPDKGRVLTSMSKFWFDLLNWMPNHLITMDVAKYPPILRKYAKDLDQRSMLVKKCRTCPIECVARGYLIGSGWKDYQKTGAVCGIKLKPGYQLASKLDEPLFTPSTKAELGTHDENISYPKVEEIVGKETAAFLREETLRVYAAAADYAWTRGIIIADTKFEFGYLGPKDAADSLILIDEVLTCDSSRFWPAASWGAGRNPPSLDKQYVRDYLETLAWNKTPPGPELPPKVVKKTRELYLKAYRQLTGKEL